MTTAGVGTACPHSSSRAETRRFRPMTSDVSALSSIVAKGHQAMLTFSPPPLKFRTAGFPQYGFKRVCPWRPSPLPQAYTPFKWKSGLQVLIPGIPPGHMSVLAPTHSPNGPWLPRGLYCPPGLSLTMAISEPLHASRQFNVYFRLALRSCASRRGSPIYSASPLAACRHQCSGSPSRCF